MLVKELKFYEENAIKLNSNRSNRMIGKTTRAINEGIQILFTKGSVYFPDRMEIVTALEQNHGEYRNKDKETICIDPDWAINDQVQRELARRVVERLKREHRVEFKISENYKTIFLPDEKFVKDGV